MKTEKIGKEFCIDWYSVAPGVWGIKDQFVNVYLIHNAAENSWVLVDAGLKTTAPKVLKVAEKLFWPGITPKAIILTHAHFDHVGSLKTLAERWNVPVYAHVMERPYLNGTSSYPPPDPCVGGGMMSLMSFIYPKGPIDIGERLQLLPEDGTLPFLPDWQYIHTPGHAPGHISLFRKSDKVLIAGDAFVTTKQESAIAVMRQTRVLSGPPKYFTYNWGSAAASVRKLAALNPELAATGHGRPMKGEELRTSLHNLAENFEEDAVPAYGRYVDEPALVNKEGVQYLPPAKTNRLLLQVFGITATAVLAIYLLQKQKSRTPRFAFFR